jgi:hypothetical protein
MKIIIHTERGVFESQESNDPDVTFEQFEEAIECLVDGRAKHITIKTASGSTVIGGELMKNAVVEIIR